MIPFLFRGFWDVPRFIAVRYRGKLLLLQSAFDDDLDEYPDTYSVYILHESVEDSLQMSSWMFLDDCEKKGIGEIRVDSVKFDESRRVSLDPSCLDELLSREGPK